MTDLSTPPPLPRNVKARKSLAWIPFVILCVILLAGCIAGFLTMIFGVMRSSDAYKNAVAIAHANPRVAEALGTPIKESFFFTGNIHVQSNSSGETGNANLVIPMSGPHGSGSLFAVARKSDGIWHYSVLSMSVNGGKNIDLLPATVAGTPQPNHP